MSLEPEVVNNNNNNNNNIRMRSCGLDCTGKRPIGVMMMMMMMMMMIMVSRMELLRAINLLPLVDNFLQ